MPKKKRQPAKTQQKGQTPGITWAVVGLIQLVISGLALVRFGLLGKQIANLFRLLVGDSYLLVAGLSAIFGLVMLIYNKPLHFKFKRSLGLVIAILNILLIQSSIYFESELVNYSFLNVFLFAIRAEFQRAAVTKPVGGGLLGALGYQLLYPLLGGIGLRIVTIVFIPIGILMFFDVKFATVLRKFQLFSQLFISKNKQAGAKIKDQYTTLRVKQAEKEAPQAAEKETATQSLSDPLLGEEAKFFPNVGDFTDVSDSAASAKKDTSNPEDLAAKDFAETNNLPEIEPQIQFPKQPVADDTETEIERPETLASPAEPDNSLPRPVSYASEDQQLLQDQSLNKSKQTKAPLKTASAYKKPPLHLLDAVKNTDQTTDKALIRQNTQTLQATFKSFGVNVIIKKAILGPTITRYEVQPAVGVKVSRIVNLADDLALALAAKDIRIEAPIPGKPFIGIEVPNRTTSVVAFKEVMQNQDKQALTDPLDVPLGKDVSGQIISAKLTKMPHLLIAGSTGSGKSVAINTILTSVLMKAKPDEVKLVLIDPKMVELSVYNGVPHLLIPVVTDSKLAANALNKTVKEMERRYKLFAASGARNIGEFNEKVHTNNQDKTKSIMNPLPYILVVVDELSDLMMVGGHDVEGAIVRLGQMARAAGIHMILATQRPSVDVITGLIKANVPSRISFAVSSGIDSRTILDQNGAEKLLGRGDMLYMPVGAAKPERIQGAYISSHEVEKVIAWVKEQQPPEYDQGMIPQNSDETAASAEDEPEDEFYAEAVDLVRRQQTASVSMLQRRFRIGYNRAARIIDEMEARGVVGQSEGSKPRQVLLPPEKATPES